MSRPWASFEGLSIVSSPPIDLEDRPELRQAVADGIERGFAGDLPALPEAAESYLLRVGSEDVGLMSVLRDYPESGTAAILTLAVDPAARGNAYATRALIAAEHRLLRDGVERLVTRVPRTNGRGLYFMLRAGFTPFAGPQGDDATWFARGGTR